MSFSERLAQQLAQAPTRTVFNNATTYNAQHKPTYDWQREASTKRSIR